MIDEKMLYFSGLGRDVNVLLTTMKKSSTRAVVRVVQRRGLDRFGFVVISMASRQQG